MRRVFIAWVHALFHRSVRLLLEHPQLAIVGDSQSTTLSQAELEALHPDIIIVELLENAPEACTTALRLVQSCSWNPRLVCVGLHDNTVRIYYAQQYTLEEAPDLLHLILSA